MFECDPEPYGAEQEVYVETNSLEQDDFREADGYIEEDEMVIQERPGYAFAGNPFVPDDMLHKRLVNRKDLIVFILLLVVFICLAPIVLFLVEIYGIAHGNLEMLNGDIATKQPKTFRQLAQQSANITSTLEIMNSELDLLKAWNETMYHGYLNVSRDIKRQGEKILEEIRTLRARVNLIDGRFSAMQSSAKNIKSSICFFFIIGWIMLSSCGCTY